MMQPGFQVSKFESNELLPNQKLNCILWYCIVLQVIALYCMVLHDIVLYLTVLHGIALLASARGLYLARHLST